MLMFCFGIFTVLNNMSGHHHTWHIQPQTFGYKTNNNNNFLMHFQAHRQSLIFIGTMKVKRLTKEFNAPDVWATQSTPYHKCQTFLWFSKAIIIRFYARIPQSTTKNIFPHARINIIDWLNQSFKCIHSMRAKTKAFQRAEEKKEEKKLNPKMNFAINNFGFVFNASNLWNWYQRPHKHHCAQLLSWTRSILWFWFFFSFLILDVEGGRGMKEL